MNTTSDVEPDPLARFEEEHRAALAQLARLDRALSDLAEKGTVGSSMAAAREVLAFLQDAVQRHNQDEELALFPLLADHAPCEVFEEEHGTLRDLESRFAMALDAKDIDAVAGTGRVIVDLLRAHIDRENEVLFPAARNLLGASGLQQVAERLAVIDASR